MVVKCETRDFIFVKFIFLISFIELASMEGKRFCSVAVLLGILCLVVLVLMVFYNLLSDWMPRKCGKMKIVAIICLVE